MPWPLYLVSLVLSGGIGAAFLQYLGVRATTKAQAATVNHENRLKDVAALGDALTSLGVENERLVKRLVECHALNDRYHAEIVQLRAGPGP